MDGVNRLSSQVIRMSFNSWSQLSGRSGDQWRPLLPSIVLSLGMHACVLALLFAFPSNSPPRLAVRAGDVCFNIDLVSLGDASLGTGNASTGDEVGDGRPILRTTGISPPPVMTTHVDDSRSPAESTDAIDKTTYLANDTVTITSDPSVSDSTQSAVPSLERANATAPSSENT